MPFFIFISMNSEPSSFCNKTNSFTLYIVCVLHFLLSCLFSFIFSYYLLFVFLNLLSIILIWFIVKIVGFHMLDIILSVMRLNRISNSLLIVRCAARICLFFFFTFSYELKWLKTNCYPLNFLLCYLLACFMQRSVSNWKKNFSLCHKYHENKESDVKSKIEPFLNWLGRRNIILFFSYISGNLITYKECMYHY